MRKISKFVLSGMLTVGMISMGSAVSAADEESITEVDFSKEGLSGFLHDVTESIWSDEEDQWTENWDEIERIEQTSSDEEQDVFEVDNICSLDFSIRAGELRFQEYDGETIRIEISGDDRENIRLGQEDKTLILEGIGKAKDTCMDVFCPKEIEFEEVSLDIAAGTVYADCDLYADELEVSVAAGEFLAEAAVAAKDAEIEVGAGNVELMNLTVNELDVECGVGNISLDVDGKEEDYDFEISCAAGDIALGNNSYSGLGQEKEIVNPDASGEMNLECGVGNISVQFCR